MPIWNRRDRDDEHEPRRPKHSDEIYRPPSRAAAHDEVDEWERGARLGIFENSDDPWAPAPRAHTWSSPQIVLPSQPPTPPRPRDHDRPAWSEPGPESGRFDAAPIVVGDAITSFEPRPNRYDVYTPEVVADGWSTGRITMRVASVRGYSHRYAGTPRQDDAVVALHPGTESVVFAVADGVSSAELSHIGAGVASREAVASVMADLDRSSTIDWARALTNAVSMMGARASEFLRRPVDEEQLGHWMSTTLVLGVVRPGSATLNATMVQAGDSSAWLLRGGCYTDVLRPKNDPDAGFIASTVRSLPPVPPAVRPVHVEIPSDSVLLVGTDGFGDPLGDGSGAVGRLFAEALATPPRTLAMAHVLDFSRETFDDDRTLLALWPTARTGS